MLSQIHSHHRCVKCQWRLVLVYIYQSTTPTIFISTPHEHQHVKQRHQQQIQWTTNTQYTTWHHHCAEYKTHNNIQDSKYRKILTHSHWQSWKVRKRTTFFYFKYNLTDQNIPTNINTPPHIRDRHNKQHKTNPWFYIHLHTLHSGTNSDL